MTEPELREITSTKLRRIYRCVPSFECVAGCRRCCVELFQVFEVEKNQIRQYIRRQQLHIRRDVPVHWRDVFRAMLDSDYLDRNKHTLRCGLLDASGHCAIYSVRPLICRLFGVDVDLPCEAGGRPNAIVSKEESDRLWNELRAVDLKFVKRRGRVSR